MDAHLNNPDALLVDFSDCTRLDVALACIMVKHATDVVPIVNALWVPKSPTSNSRNEPEMSRISANMTAHHPQAKNNNQSEVTGVSLEPALDESGLVMDIKTESTPSVPLKNKSKKRKDEEVISLESDDDTLLDQKRVTKSQWRKTLRHAQHVIFFIIPGLLIGLPLAVMFFIALAMKPTVSIFIPFVGFVSYIGYLFFLNQVTRRGVISNIASCMPVEPLNNEMADQIDPYRGNTPASSHYPFTSFANRMYYILYEEEKK
jgi:hypothetical protein